jgi:dihydrofolate reductase
MTINIISCVANYKNKLAIGRNGALLCKLSEDMKSFKCITTNRLSQDSLLDRNVVLMGRKTWFSIPREKRPLKDRLNLVLTNDIDLLKLSPYPLSSFFYKGDIASRFCKNVYFITFEQFLDFYNCTKSNVYVIGGSQIYDLFLKTDNDMLLPTRIFLTEVYDYH